ncbi:uncharacterized protein LOC116613981 isoform X2 [Nematostella vectensis]|uniref:uncharacterized protein LOC116613981 isoform X2 n=1 Tax=Nematostella vectensis TaxID=45351 RepID=UPI0020778E69|nr:uncharacterized protein LOC116613981 isoform X2 [Nematostella vectensis]
MNRVEQAVCRIREKLPNGRGFLTLGSGCVVKSDILAESLGWKCPIILVTTTDVISPELLGSEGNYVAEFLSREKKGLEVFDLKSAAECCRVLASREVGKEASYGLSLISVEPLDKRGFLKRIVKKSSLQTTRPINCHKFAQTDFISEFTDGFFCNVIRDTGNGEQDFETRTYQFALNSSETREFILKDFVGPNITLDTRNFPVDQQPIGAIIFSKHGDFVGAFGACDEELVPLFIPDAVIRDEASDQQENNNLADELQRPASEGEEAKKGASYDEKEEGEVEQETSELLSETRESLDQSREDLTVRIPVDAPESPETPSQESVAMATAAEEREGEEICQPDEQLTDQGYVNEVCEKKETTSVDESPGDGEKPVNGDQMDDQPQKEQVSGDVSIEAVEEEKSEAITKNENETSLEQEEFSENIDIDVTNVVNQENAKEEDSDDRETGEEGKAVKPDSGKESTEVDAGSEDNEFFDCRDEASANKTQMQIDEEAKTFPDDTAVEQQNDDKQEDMSESQPDVSEDVNDTGDELLTSGDDAVDKVKTVDASIDDQDERSALLQGEEKGVHDGDKGVGEDLNLGEVEAGVSDKKSSGTLIATEKINGEEEQVDGLTQDQEQPLPNLKDDLLSEAVTNNPKVLEDLAKCLDTEYQHGGVPCWRDLAEVLAIPPEAYEHCSSFSETSPTEDMMMFLSATKPQLTISDMKDGLRAIGRQDVLQILERCVTRGITSNESVIGSLVERDDTDLLGRIAMKLDPGYTRNWKSLAIQMEIPRRVFRNFGTQQRHNSALLLFKYLPIHDPDLTIKEIRDACEEMDRHDVVKVLDSSGIPGDDPVKAILDDADFMDELTDYLNDDSTAGGWRELAVQLGVPVSKCSIFQSAGSKSPTALLLRSMEECEPDVTVEELILALVAMKRQDVIQILEKHFNRDDIRSILEDNNCLPPEPVKEEGEEEELVSEEDK